MGFVFKFYLTNPNTRTLYAACRWRRGGGCETKTPERQDRMGFSLFCSHCLLRFRVLSAPRLQCMTALFVFVDKGIEWSGRKPPGGWFLGAAWQRPLPLVTSADFPKLHGVTVEPNETLIKTVEEVMCGELFDRNQVSIKGEIRCCWWGFEPFWRCRQGLKTKT